MGLWIREDSPYHLNPIAVLTRSGYACDRRALRQPAGELRDAISRVLSKLDCHALQALTTFI